MWKYILFPFGVKSLTGNVEILHMLNNLSYCVSYPQMEEIDTAPCVCVVLLMIQLFKHQAITHFSII